MIRLWRMMSTKKVGLILLLTLLEATSFLLLPTLASDALNRSAGASSQGPVLIIGTIMALATIVAIVLGVIATRLSAQESQGLGNSLRKSLFKKVLSFSQEELVQFQTSTLLTRTTNDVMQIQMVTMMMLRLIIMSPLIMIVSFFFAFQRESQLAWIFAITLPLIILFASIVLKFASPVFRSTQKKTDRLNKVFREGLTGIRVIRAFGTTHYEEKRFDDANKDFRDTIILANSILALILPGMLLVICVANTLIFTNGSHLIAANKMEIGNLIAFIQYGVQVLFSVLQMAMILFFLPRAQVSAERILEIMDTDIKIQDQQEALDFPTDKPVTLSFSNVDFCFPGAQRPALEGINFKAKAGDTIAVIGGTGSGKTTLAKLLPRLYDTTAGEIKINGHNIKAYKQAELRKHIGYAPQNALLFHGTIASNVRYGKPEASEEDIWDALNIAQAEFVDNLPEKLDSRVEQRGQNFSGGQRQRLSIARAIVGQPAIYIFDDSFSALDYQTDYQLREALRPLAQNAITMIIAQRVNTVMNADQILVLDNGKIVGAGTHEELKANNKIYKDIVHSQMKGGDDDE